MLILSIIIIVAIAALTGYAYGLRRRPPRFPGESTGVTIAPLPSTTVADSSGAIAAEIGRIDAEKARIIRRAEGEAALLRHTLADGEALRCQSGEFRDERARLFRVLADLRGENARYRQLVIDIENNAPPPILAGATGPDDLKLIVGIGPVLERMLHNLGIMSFQQIARWSERDIADFDARLPEFPGRIRRDQWVTQARSLHQATYGDGTSDLRPDGRRP